MAVGLIVNPTAGRGTGKNFHQMILDEFAKLGVDVVDLTSRSVEEAKAKTQVAIAHRQIDALVVAGGDGMVHLGVNLVVDAKVPLGPKFVEVLEAADSRRPVGQLCQSSVPEAAMPPKP